MPSSEHSNQDSSTYRRPRTRQRVHKDPPPLDVPDINDDAAERKRVLNVLAQRRYRERMRQERKGGASKATRSKVDKSSASAGPCQTDGQGAAEPAAQVIAPGDEPVNATIIQETTLESVNHALAGESVQANGTTIPSMDFISSTSLPDIMDFGLAWDFSSMPMSPISLPLDSSNTTLPQGELSAIASSSTVTLSTRSPSPSTIDPSLFSLSPPSSASSPPTEELASNPYPFPDSYLLPLPELKILGAFLRIAGRLGSTTSVWDPAAISHFYLDAASPSSTSAISALPPTWRPVPTQLTTPHHPVLDFLPWPSVRDKAIQILSLPSALRPAVASASEEEEEGASSMALVKLVYDIEDGAEGVRIWGDDPYDAGSWEVGQVVFERWWFLFDREVVENSNRWRALRGAPVLRMGKGSG